MPASLAPSASTSFGHFSSKRLRPGAAAAIDADADAAVRHDRRQRIGQRQPGDEAERGGKLQLATADQQQRRGKIAVRGFPVAAAPAAPALLALRDDPQPAGIAVAARAPAPAGWSSRPSRALRACIRRGWRSAPVQSSSEERLGGGLAPSRRPCRRSPAHVEQHERAGQAEHGAQLDRHRLEGRRPARRTT